MNIITISRLVGSYGDEIAAKVAEKMGLEFIGRTGLHELAMSCDPEYSEACTLYETEHGPSFFERLFFDRLHTRVFFEALTFEQASRGNVVMVGRGANGFTTCPAFCVGVIAARNTSSANHGEAGHLPRRGLLLRRQRWGANQLIKTVFERTLRTCCYNLMIHGPLLGGNRRRRGCTLSENGHET
jgi:hypothetical protein